MPFLDHFGLLAPIYPRVIPLSNVEQIIRLAGLPVKGILLDAGGGTGRVAKAIRYLAGEIVVADLSMGMLRQIKGQDNLFAINSHTEKLPFANETFEAVIMVDALHHVCDHGETANELWRVLQQGGRIVIQEPDIRSTAVKLVALVEKIALMRSHFISPPKIASLFNYPGTTRQIERDHFNAWVIIEKGIG
jgi:demethylmenaquinone methyltransferase/2-methoxy-6-polyprenyl-1,4-benzoquinol methylase